MFAETLLNNTRLLVYSGVAIVATALVVHLAPYLADPHYIRRNSITGPFLARFSDVWLGWVAVQGRRSEIVHNLHKKYGAYTDATPLPHRTDDSASNC